MSISARSPANSSADRITQESAADPVLRLPEPSQPVAPVASRLARQAGLVLPRLRRRRRRAAAGRVRPVRRRHARASPAACRTPTGRRGTSWRRGSACRRFEARSAQPEEVSGRGSSPPHAARAGSSDRRCGCSYHQRLMRNAEVLAWFREKYGIGDGDIGRLKIGFADNGEPSVIARH